MEVLKKELNKIIETLPKNEQEIINEKLNNLVSVYPFNKYEYILSMFIGMNKISFDEYLEIRSNYIKRNKYLPIFEISAPRTFGEGIEKHLKKLAPELLKPTKNLDPTYSGEYDLLYKFPNEKKIKIEVKASRAVDFNSKKPLYQKALSWESNACFDMNFQQIKPKCCDVFVWVGVWKDVIKYWVLASKEVEENRYYSKGQHRGNSGEGQLHLTNENIDEFKEYEVKEIELIDKIIEAYNRQKM
jgi:hypothetical protein